MSDLTREVRSFFTSPQLGPQMSTNRLRNSVAALLLAGCGVEGCGAEGPALHTRDAGQDEQHPDGAAGGSDASVDGLPWGGTIALRVGADSPSNDELVVRGWARLLGVHHFINEEARLPRGARPLAEEPTEPDWVIPGAQPTDSNFRPELYTASSTVEMTNGNITVSMQVDVNEPFHPAVSEDVPFEAAFEAGPWTLLIPAFDGVPAFVRDDIFPGATGSFLESVRVVTAANGLPSAVEWEPSEGGSYLTVSVTATGPNDASEWLCWGRFIPNTGSLPLPVGCVGAGEIDSDVYDTYQFSIIEFFETDVAYSGHRVRVELNTPVFLSVPVPTRHPR